MKRPEASERLLAATRSAVASFVLRGLRELWHPPRGQVPALDALRAIAVLLVILGHTRSAYLEHGGQESLFTLLPFVRAGWMGVDLFFVLSGYFIGKQLWRELEGTRTISLKRFVLRRGLRIWPLYFVCFAFAAFVLGRAWSPAGRGWSDVVFVTNYLDRGVIPGGWSLCTEEQFYLLAPLLLIVSAPRLGSARAYRKYLVGALILLPVLRAVTWWSVTNDFWRHDLGLFLQHLYTPFHLHSDGLVLGLLISNVETTGPGDLEKSFLSSGWAVLASVLSCGVLVGVQRDVFTFTGITLVFGAITTHLLVKRRPLHGLLDARFFYLVSRLSFGMYLNHRLMQQELGAYLVRDLPGNRFPALHATLAFLVISVLSAAVATLTFCLVERPFLALRRALLDRPAPRSGLPAEARAEGVEPLDMARAAGGRR